MLPAKFPDRIINDERGINRVVYDICGWPAVTRDWE